MSEVPVAYYTDQNSTNPAVNKCFAYFYEYIEEDKAATVRDGIPRAKSTIYLHKEFPGITSMNYDKPAKDKDKIEFPSEWKRFQDKQQPVMSGTPLDMWPMMSRTMVFEMKALNVHTVEQLIGLPDGSPAMQKIMGLREMQKKAKEFLELSMKPKLLEEARQREAEKDKLLSDAQEAIKVLQAQVTELMANQKKKPGRKPKELQP